MVAAPVSQRPQPAKITNSGWSTNRPNPEGRPALDEARHWGFGLCLSSSDRYENQILPSGFPSGSPEEALDCACRLYLDNPY